MSNSVSRRQFLKETAAAGIAGAAVNPWWQMQAMAQSAGGVTDYKALVCLFLYGGNDGNNLLMPCETEDYRLYAKARQGLALSDQLLITPSNTAGRRFALHAAMPLLKKRFDAGQMALLANIGPLMVPTTKKQYEDRSVPLPNYLFSHADQQAQWQTDSFDKSLQGGWGGRMLDGLVPSGSTNRNYSCVSVTGSALWGTNVDASLLPYRVPSSGQFGFEDHVSKGSQAPQDPLSVALDDLMAKPQADVFGQEWLLAMQRSMENQRVLATALEGASLKAVFPDTGLGRQMRMIARLISVRGGLGLLRQCFFCSLGGFDTHGDDQVRVQQDNFKEIDDAVDAFCQAMTELGLTDKVTLFTASDFNRTLVSNSRGSDHAWGNHQLVVGGAVKGGKLYGQFPNHTVNGPDDIGGGVWVPSLSLDHLGVELGRWFGAADSLAQIFPRKGYFTHDLGLMAGSVS